MAMSDANKKVLKDLAHLVIDEVEPQLIADAAAKLPVEYQPYAQMIIASLNPQLVKALDAKVDAI